MSVTLTFHTAASVRESRVEDFNSLARRVHLNPREPGRSAIVDTAKIGALAVWAAGRRIRVRRGRSAPNKSDIATWVLSVGDWRTIPRK